MANAKKNLHRYAGNDVNAPLAEFLQNNFTLFCKNTRWALDQFESEISRQVITYKVPFLWGCSVLLLKGDEMTTHRNPSLRSALCGSICVVLLSLVAQMRARIERVYSVKPPIRNELRKLCHAFWPCCV